MIPAGESSDDALPGSFRDPGGQVRLERDRVVRYVRAGALSEFQHFLESPLQASLAAAGMLIETRPLSVAPGERAPAIDGEFAAAFEHPRIPFVSYPYEWPAEMLWEAARLTLTISREALKEGWGLKDASPFNILFAGPTPVFVDVLSFEKREPGDATWLPYGQFMRMFVLPLLAARELRLPIRSAFISVNEGLEPRQLYPAMPFLSRIRRPALSVVTLPFLLENRGSRGSPRAQPKHLDAAKARFILERLFAHLESTLESVRPAANAVSRWSGYAGGEAHGGGYSERKASVVGGILSRLAPKSVLDLGCNTGGLSLLAARGGSRVVAVDSDAASVARVHRSAAEMTLDILSLVVDLTDPTPARGWRNGEYLSFLARSRGAFDTVIAMSLIHHLMVTGGIPLDEIIRLLADLSSDVVIVEFVPRDDPMFIALARGRDALHQGHTRERFVTLASRHFEILGSDTYPEGGREVFTLRKRKR